MKSVFLMAAALAASLAHGQDRVEKSIREQIEKALKEAADAAAKIDTQSASPQCETNGVSQTRVSSWEPLPVGKCNPKIIPNPNEGLVEKPGVGGCPSGMIRVDDFCMDQYEASLVDKETGEHWSPFHNPAIAKRRKRAVSLEGAIPQGYITGEQASAACKHSGKRLCSDKEWLRACQGPGNKSWYPYGGTKKSDRIPYACNEEGKQQHPAVRLFGKKKNPDGTPVNPYHFIQDACISQLPDTVARTGSKSQCYTPDRIYDLMGNVHEWTSNKAGTFRGGYFMDTRRNGHGCHYETTKHDMGHWDYSTGFRCCANLPES